MTQAIVTSVHNLEANDKMVQKSVPLRNWWKKWFFHTNDKHVPQPRAIKLRIRIFARAAKLPQFHATKNEIIIDVSTEVWYYFVFINIFQVELQKLIVHQICFFYSAICID